MVGSENESRKNLGKVAKQMTALSIVLSHDVKEKRVGVEVKSLEVVSISTSLQLLAPCGPKTVLQADRGSAHTAAKYKHTRS